ncbi:MAG: VWA domain-containing protein [Acidobacteriia bacterium]|nr:VWA domain-containing protein [Terriglobia bacterium]
MAVPSSLPAQQQSGALYRFRVETDVVLVNVVARDKNGDIVRGLKKEDFTVLEDGKPQRIASFDFEQAETQAVPQPAQAVLVSPRTTPTVPAVKPTDKLEFRDHRVIVLFLDLTSMQPEEIERAVQAGRKFVNQQMTPADMVAVMSLSTSLQVNQDLTSDHDLLNKALARLNPASSGGFDAGMTGDTEGTADSAQPFTPDDTEYNIFNTDRRLEALQSLAESLARIEQKKSVIYFSSGMDKTGIENQSQLRNAINRAVRSNVAIYPMDMRGLQAIIPGGEAQQASLRGTSPYSGASVRNAFDSNFSSQETLVTLAADTGGRAFLDSNDFNAVFKKVQEDTSAYYVLGYRSTNPARDGHFRKITVKTSAPNVKIEFRKGYYAPRDFAHSNKDDREQQLVDELSSELSSTDLDVFLSAAYFRLGEGRFYVPVSLVVPGSEIPFTQAGDKDKASLDIIGVVRDELNRPVGNVRDTVKLNLDESQQVRRKNVQYQAGFTLPPGKFHLKFVLRENQSGRLGSFETDVVIPDYKKEKVPIKLSSVVMGTQIQTAGKRKSDNVLAKDGAELIPNVLHVFSPGQHLYFYYEVYEPVKDTHATDKTKQIRLLTSIQFFQGKVKAFETPLVEAYQLSAPDRKAAVFQFDVPLSQLKPGLYTCQVTVIDDAAGTFAFPRLALLVKNEAAKPATAAGGE